MSSGGRAPDLMLANQLCCYAGQGQRMQFNLLKRRELITLVGGAVMAWPLAARAQQPERVRRIGVLSGFAETDPDGQSEVSAFRHGLQRLGWTGSNVRIAYRWGMVMSIAFE